MCDVLDYVYSVRQHAEDNVYENHPGPRLMLIALFFKVASWYEKILLSQKIFPRRPRRSITVRQRAARSILPREGGGRWPVRPRVRGVLPRKIVGSFSNKPLSQNRVMGTNSTKPRTFAKKGTNAPEILSPSLGSALVPRAEDG